jgi:hypothetical protein
MLTHQDSYTVSDDFEKIDISRRIPSDNLLKNSFEATWPEPCHHMLHWEDSLEERPIVFKIRDYTNNEENSATVS